MNKERQIDEITRIIKNRMSDYAIFDYDKESNTIIIEMSDRVVDLMCECVSVDLNIAGYRKADKMRVQTAKEILQSLYDHCFELVDPLDNNCEECYGQVKPSDILNLAKEYGVEVDK